MTAEDAGEPVWPVEALAGVDMRIFAMLRRVVEIGEYKRAWGEEDVARVALLLSTSRTITSQALASSRAKVRALERECTRLRAQILLEFEQGQEPASGHFIIVSPLRARIVREAAAGRPVPDIGRMLGMTREAVSRHIERAAKQMDATSTDEGLSMVRSGEVTVVVKAVGKK